MDLGLRAKVAIVTGGSAGLGRATAICLAREGARVAVVARGRERLDAVAEEIAADHGRDAVLAVAADVSSAPEVERVVGEVHDTFGGVDILVNNAGTAKAMPFLDVDDATWQADLDLKLFAAVRFTRLVVPSMRARGGGRVVNILNTGSRQPGAQSVPTTVSRAAGLALTKALSKEYASDQILVNAVLIGLVKSDQWTRRWDDAGQPVPLEQWYAQMGSGIPVGRIADAEELGDLVTFLVSSRASYVTGTAVNFDGGQSAVI